MQVKSRGFSLIELVIVIAVAAVLLAIALPSFQSVFRSNRVATATNEMIATLSLARGEAIRNARGAIVCPSADGAICGDDWTAGWIIWADHDGNGVPDDDEVIRFVQGKSRTVVEGPEAGVQFDPRGRIVGAATSVAVQPDECGGQALRRIITIGVTGQVSRASAMEVCE
ncbi:GspH/FimT family pseudopilin [Luteimonas sp. BDR2-5]|uniref:GspH/FimT family pseudopilin n=1 Tax=Proluteimonas luteida TaxID=2878685 RepID=UPI001E489AB9|nr:GspH/FimT family pseudopilin [Luteimonas sp. BDR2-5]MCD9029779.1 GspH/FimT family pseudopilin [Luteimonas sp. BDR2-5]